MLTFAKKYQRNDFSQFGENGIIDECLKRINPELHTAVEFGAPDVYYCSNIYHLQERGWNLFYYDPNPQHPAVNRATITPDNVNDLPKCSVLSIDIDGNDYNVWQAYTGKSDIVIIEINSSLHPESTAMVSDMQHGTCYLRMLELGVSKDYFLLCHTGNLIFIRKEHWELFPEVNGDPLIDWKLYFNTSWL